MVHAFIGQRGVGGRMFKQGYFAAAQHQGQSEPAPVAKGGVAKVFRKIEDVADAKQIQHFDSGNVERALQGVAQGNRPALLEVVIFGLVHLARARKIRVDVKDNGGRRIPALPAMRIHDWLERRSRLARTDGYVHFAVDFIIKVIDGSDHG